MSRPMFVLYVLSQWTFALTPALGICIDGPVPELDEFIPNIGPLSGFLAYNCVQIQG